MEYKLRIGVNMSEGKTQKKKTVKASWKKLRCDISRLVMLGNKIPYIV